MMNILDCPKPPPLPRSVKLVEFGENGRPHTRKLFQSRESDLAVGRLRRALPKSANFGGGKETVVPITLGEFVIQTIMETV